MILRQIANTSSNANTTKSQITSNKSISKPAHSCYSCPWCSPSPQRSLLPYFTYSDYDANIAKNRPTKHYRNHWWSTIKTKQTTMWMSHKNFKITNPSCNSWWNMDIFTRLLLIKRKEIWGSRTRLGRRMITNVPFAWWSTEKKRFWGSGVSISFIVVVFGIGTRPTRRVRSADWIFINDCSLYYRHLPHNFSGSIPSMVFNDQLSNLFFGGFYWGSSERAREIQPWEGDVAVLCLILKVWRLLRSDPFGWSILYLREWDLLSFTSEYNKNITNHHWTCLRWSH